MPLDVRLHGLRSGIEPLPLGGQHLDKLPTTSQQRRQLLRLCIGQRARRGMDHLSKVGQHLRIEHISLGELTHRPGESRT